MKAMQRTAAVLILCIISVFALPFTAFAGEYKSIDVRIAANCLSTGGITNRLTYDIAIEPLEDAPPPQALRLSVSEGNRGVFVIPIDEPGFYYYRLYMIKGTKDELIYDDTVYTASVFVENTEDMQDLRYALTFQKNGLTVKPDEVSFEIKKKNSDWGVPDPPPGPRSPGGVIKDPDEPTPPDEEPPIEDASVGAGLEEGGILIDVGAAVKKIVEISGASGVDPETLNNIDDSFLGSIPVVYLLGIALCIVLCAVLIRRGRQDSREKEK